MSLSKNTFILLLLLNFSNILICQEKTEKEFVHQYNQQGDIIAEGWILNGERENYWYFYHPNGAVAKKGHYHKGEQKGYWYFYNRFGKLEKEGHFNNGKAENWWIFYDENTQRKYQFKDNKKNGFALLYNNKKLMKAEKYKNDEKVGEWTSLIAFKLDNPNVSLK